MLSLFVGCCAGGVEVAILDVDAPRDGDVKLMKTSRTEENYLLFLKAFSRSFGAPMTSKVVLYFRKANSVLQE